MIEEQKRRQIIDLVKREVVPAIGCTEPIAVALCVAKARETLGIVPERITVFLSANMLKNAMGVGIPGTGMVGLPIAVALGAIVGKSSYELEVLRDVDADAVEKGKRYIDEGRVDVKLKDGTCDKLYIETIAQHTARTARCVIAGGHTHFTRIELDGVTLLDDSATQHGQENGEEEELCLRDRKSVV